MPNEAMAVEVQGLLEQELSVTLRCVSHEKRHFVVACESDQEVRSLLDLDGSKLDGHIVRVQRAEYSMSGDEIFAFVRRLLEQDEELRILRRSYGGPPDSPREVRAVQTDHAVTQDKNSQQAEQKNP